MIKFEKDIIPGSHIIESHNILTEEETGRVVAVFYNDYDMDVVFKMQDQITELKAKLAKAEADLSWAVVPEGQRF